jgi:predicted nucleotide-binding protein
MQSAATCLEFYLGWLALRRVARSDGPIPDPLRQDAVAFFDRLDALLDMAIDRDQRLEIAQVLMPIHGFHVNDDVLRNACSRLADLLALVLSEPNMPLRRPRIDQVTYARLLQLSLHIDEHEHGAGQDLWAEQLAERSNVSLDRVHTAIARMISDGVVHLPIGDEGGRPDVFRLSDPATAEDVLYAFDPELSSTTEGELPHAQAGHTPPNVREVVVVHGCDAPRAAFFFELLRRLGVAPLAFDELIARAGAGSPSIRELIQAAFARAQAVLILFTGDDLANLRPDLLGPREAGAERAPSPQPRPHILFEAGVAVALQPERTIVVEVPPLRGLLNLDGVHLVRFATGAPEERTQLASRLRAAGCELDMAGNQWLNLGFPSS